MVKDGQVHDIDEFDQDRWCEYIFYRGEVQERCLMHNRLISAGLYRTSYARISRSTITDTELQIGQFVVPEYGQVVEDDSHPTRYMRSFKEALPEEHVRPYIHLDTRVRLINLLSGSRWSTMGTKRRVGFEVSPGHSHL
jgi:hypothetical protein